MMSHVCLQIILFVIIGYVFGQNLGPEGAECSSDGVIGKCVSVYRCATAGEDIANKQYPPICSFEGRTPIICCTDCELVNDTRILLFDAVLGTLTKTGTSKAKDKCLDYIHELDYPCKTTSFLKKTLKKKLDQTKKCHYLGVGFRRRNGGFGVVGGQHARRKQYPHMALLGYGDTVETASWLCGGTVISDRFILTAAHCVSSRAAGPVRFITLGILRRSDPSQLWQRYIVRRAIPHPGYKPPSKYHDIALLQTDRQITFKSNVLPACLHLNQQFDMNAYATGWGAVGSNAGLSDVLQTVSLGRFTDEQCSQLYPEHRQLVNGLDNSSQICYGDQGGSGIPTDTCEGDSGGPLQSSDHEKCAFTILGVTSYGRACGGRGGAGVYTRVNHYVPWIESVVWP